VALAPIKALHTENAPLREHVTALRAMHTRDDARFAAIELKLAALTAMGEPRKTELFTKGQLLEQRALAGRPRVAIRNVEDRIVLALAHSAAMLGIDGYVVRVEADSAAGTPSFSLIGLPDRALGEARDRVRAAIVNSGYGFPAGRVLVNLAPADIRKVGPGFDLAIALALLAIDEQVDTLALQRFVALGELALDGSLRPTRGILPMTIGARNAGFDTFVVPQANASEAALVDGVTVYGIANLHEAVAIALGHGDKFKRPRGPARFRPAPSAHGDFGDVRGQSAAKRALEIAAAGGHNAVLVGPPGCGKTMLARRLPSILPAMSAAEALEVTKIYSVAGILEDDAGIVGTRPFRAPHHTISQVALCGGGATPRPGEISLAQHGVLFLDEVPEFARSALEVMRQPLEEGTITIARAAGTFVYPARFTLVASMNPCPCGFRGVRANDCRCDDAAVARYVAKLSGPLLDRIDLHVDVARVPFDEMVARAPGEPSSAIRARVEAARALQRERYAGTPYHGNAAVAGADVRRYCTLDAGATDLLRKASARGHLSARALDRIARVARTIADLGGAPSIAAAHVAEAIGYRSLERRGLAA
jgi:magnesium chelatase family protein